MHLLLTRTDRLGDLLLSLPAMLQVRKALPHAGIDFLCRPAYAEVLTPWCAEHSIRLLSYPADNEGVGFARNLFKGASYDGVCFLFSETPLLRAAWRARVPVRIGNYSKWASFVFLTGGERQARSKAEKTEGQYNVALAEKFLAALGLSPANFSPAPSLQLPTHPGAARKAQTLLEALGIFAPHPYGVLHPGMGGSALNLSTEQYLDLAKALLDRAGVPVVLTVGPAPKDGALKQALLKEVPRLKVAEGISLETLAEVFRGASWVVAPSTGPLHLAHYTGTATVGLFSPVQSQKVERWSPWGGTGKIATLAPTDPCPAHKSCHGVSCPYFLCMDRVAWTKLILNEVLNA